MNEYQKMRERHQQEYNAWTEGKLFYAFDKDQFSEGMKEIGLNPEDVSKITRGPAGSYIRTEHAEDFIAMLQRHGTEIREAIMQDKTGEGFAFQAMYTELIQHEYSYTQDTADALEALNLSLPEVQNSPALSHALELAEDAAACR